MAANQHETSLKITGKNEASKPLKQATDDITRLEDAIKAGGAALDGNTGNLKNYAKTAQNVFKPLGEVAATAVGKITAAAEDLEKALEDANADIGVTKQQLRSYQDAAEAIQKQVTATQALRDAQDARRKSEASNLAHLKDAEEAHLALVKETSDAKIAGIFAEHDQSVQQRRDMQAQRKALIDNAKVEKAAYEERKKRFSDERDRLKQAMSVKGANLMGLLAQDAANNRASKSNDDAYKAFRQDNIDQRKAFETPLAELDKRIAAQKAAADVEVQAVQKTVAAERDASAARIKAQKDLTDATVKESKERMAALDKELAGLRKSRTAQNRLVTGTTKSLAAQEARAAAIGLDREKVSKVRDRAVSLQSQLTDPNAMRRLSREIVGGPESQARGMSALSEQTRRAADAQRLLNGQVKAGASGFSSARSYVMGLVSAYAIYATTITQASAAVDAFKTKQSFEITVSNTLGGDMSKAAGEFDYLSAAADKYGFSIATVGQEYAKLASTARGIGRSDKEIRSLFEGVLSVGRVNALSDEKMQDAFRAVTQILSKNQVMSEELKGQLAEALPGAVVRFAQSQGYSPDQMKEFSKDLESGKFASRDIIEYAQKELEDNAAAVLKAQGTFQATMARFQNTLFKSRADFAENGFMDELTTTIRELDEFFKSEEGKAYMIRLGQGANVVVGFMASIAKNLDTILAVSGALLTIWGASKLGKGAMSIGGVLKDAAASAAAATTVMSGTSKAVDAAGKSATVAGRGMAVASRSLGVMGVAARSLIGVLGGPVGLAVTLASLAGGALWSWMSVREAEDAAQAQTKMENIRDVINEIRAAAVDANGDVSKFVQNLGKIKGITGTQAQATRQDLVSNKQGIRIRMNQAWSQANRDDLKDGSKLALYDAVSAAMTGREIDLKAINASLDAAAKADPAAQKHVLTVQKLFEELVEAEKIQTTFNNAVSASEGVSDKAKKSLDDLTTRNRNSAEASALAAESQKKFEKALEEANETAGDVTGMEDFNRAMRKIDETRKDLEKSLKEWMDNEKAAGKAIPAEEIERRTRQIESSLSRMTGNAVRNFREIQLAAQGLTLELDEISQKMLEDFRVSDAAASGGSVALGSGRKYGEDKRSIALGIKETAEALGISAEDLATAISYETAGTFDPKKNGPVTKPWGQHRGLIQFGEPQARQHGVDWNDAVNSQLGPNGAVASYLRAAGVKPGMGLLEVYSAINAGGIGEKYFNRKDAHNGGAPGSVRDKVQNQMGGHRANARSLLGDYADAAPGVIAENAGNRELALNLFQNVSSELSEQAQKVVGYAAIANPSLATNQEFVIAFQDGDAEKIAEILRGGGDADRADEVLRVSAANDMIRSIEANIEASKTFTKAVEGLSFSGDDLKAGNRAEAVNREVAAIIKDMTQDGGSPAAALGVSSADEAEKIVRARVERQIMLDVEKQRLELMNDMSEADDKSLRNDQQRIQVQDVMNAQGERAAELARIMNELRNEEQDTGVSRSDADRNEVASLRIKAWDAENAERLAKEAKDKAEEERDKAEKAHTDRIAILQARIENLNAQLEAAVSSKDVSEQGRLKDEIRSVSDELLLATEAAKAFYGTLSGPEGELGILTMDRLGMSVKKSKSDLDQLSPEILEISGVIENSLNGAVSSFSANVAQGMKPWQALKQAVGQAIGEMLVNIGKMITQAVIANSVMSALGLPTQGASPAANAATMSGGGFLTKAVGWLGGLVGGKFHDGGIIGDPSKNVDFLGSLLNLKPGERPIIAMDGEEMLTRRDPRHRENMGASLANMSRFHTGGVIGSSPDAAAASAAAAKASPMSGIMSMLSQAPKASETVVNVHNGFDDDDLRDRVLATPQGERAVLNILSRNPQKLKALMS